MNIIAAMRDRLDSLAAFVELDVDASQLPSSAVLLGDEAVVSLLEDVAAILNGAGRIQAVLAGVAAQRCRREDGHSGLAAVHGHSTPASLIQSITGGTKADANRQVRVGTSLLEGFPPAVSAEQVVSIETPWHEPLRSALLAGVLTSAQHDAIRTGLGEPRVSGDPVVDVEVVRQAWSLAAEQLVAEAGDLPVEELAKRARIVRDLLDVAGAEERFARRYENRAFRMWVDGDGQHQARITFDDEMGLWVRSVRDAALRPRRGGPRFVSDGERAAADELSADPRTNAQLEYDLMMDILRAGALASAADVFGARQPGVRMVVVKDAVGPRDALGRLLAVGHAEDGGDALPGSVIDRGLCAVGAMEVTVDMHGNPLDLGREQRLYSSRQRVVLAVRDGGCIWSECHRPASYCEAHHCDHFGEHEGRTDVDRGVLLCRFHHMLLHNNGWRIRRDGKGPFMLHPPPGEGDPIELKSKSAWNWAWDPPPAPARAAWRAAQSPVTP